MTGITTVVRGPSAVRLKVAVADAASNKRNSLLGALVLLAAVQLMVVLDTTIVNVALPSIQSGLGFSIGGIAAMEGLGAAAGLLLGGVLVNSLGWRWVFFVNVPLAVVVAALAPRFIPVAARQSARFDLRGAASATVGLGLLVFGLSRAAEHGWADITTFAPIAIGVLGLLVFVRIEARSAQPLMPPWVFAARHRGGAYPVQAPLGAALF